MGYKRQCRRREAPPPLLPQQSQTSTRTLGADLGPFDVDLHIFLLGRGREIPRKTSAMKAESEEHVDAPVAGRQAALCAAARVDPPPPVRDQGYMSRPSAMDSRADLGAFDVDLRNFSSTEAPEKRSEVNLDSTISPTYLRGRVAAALRAAPRKDPSPPVATFSEGHRRGPWRICHRFRIVWPPKERRKWLKKRQNEVDVD